MDIRIAKTEDAAAILEIYRYYIEQTATTFEYDVPTVEAFSKRMLAIQTTYPYFVALEDDQIIGYAYASAYKQRQAYDWSAEVSVYLAPEVKKRGVGRQLYEVLEQALITQNVYQVLACITADNQESIVFHEKLGYTTSGTFQQVGYKFSTWWDIIWMQKQLMPLENPPKPFQTYLSLEVDQ